MLSRCSRCIHLLSCAASLEAFREARLPAAARHPCGDRPPADQLPRQNSPVYPRAAETAPDIPV